MEINDRRKPDTSRLVELPVGECFVYKEDIYMVLKVNALHKTAKDNVVLLGSTDQEADPAPGVYSLKADTEVVQTEVELTLVSE